MPPGDEAAAEGVPGTDGVDHVDRRCGDAHGARGPDDQRALAAERHDAGAGAAEQRSHALVGRQARREPGEIVLAQLQQVRALEDAIQPRAERGRVGEHAGADVRVDDDERRAGHALDERLHRRGDRLEVDAEGADVQDGDPRRERGQGVGGLEARRRRGALVEAVAGSARRVDLGERERRRLVGVDHGAEADAVGLEHRLQRAPEAVGGEAAEERDRLPEAPDRPRRVERPAARVGAQRVVLAGHEVHQGLAGDDDHDASDVRSSGRSRLRGTRENVIAPWCTRMAAPGRNAG